mgnify:CR=1 FL=1
MSLKAVKSKIKAVNKTGQVTKAMEAVSAAKMRKTQEWALSARPYAFSALRILRKIVSDNTLEKNTLIALGGEEKYENPLFIVLTSDRGLAGSLNASVLRQLQKFITDSDLPKSSSFMTYGRKGTEFLSSRGFNIISKNPSLPDRISIDQIREITGEAIELIKNEEVDSVYVIYSNFISTFAQEPAIRQVFPISMQEVEKSLEGIRPARGKFADLYVKDDSVSNSPYTFEPDAESVLETLLPFLAEVMIFHSALESKASEHSARMVAMKSAGDKAKEMVKDLTRIYNKERQSMITREMSEIIGGIESLK